MKLEGPNTEYHLFGSLGTTEYNSLITRPYMDQHYDKTSGERADLWKTIRNEVLMLAKEVFDE
jgi:hypothetical protein